MMVSFLNPGVLRTEMTLEKPEIIPDGMGGFLEHWTEIAIIFAHIEPLAAVSRFGADKLLEAVTHRITLRRRAEIESTMRLRRGSRIFQIVTLHDPDESGRYLVCRAREGEP